MASVRSNSLRAYEFACHHASCAPPPAGTGGSGGGGASRRNGDGAWYPRGGSKSSAPKSSEVKASDLKRGDRVHFAQKVRTISSAEMQRNGKIGIAFKDGGVTDLHPGQTLPRASRKVKLPAGSSVGKFVNKPDPKHRDARSRKAGVSWRVSDL